jgi:16S rRNA (cytidine1402-2'-O)-methyltransferase
MHEEFLRGRAGEIAGQAHERELKGEITILIGKAAAQERGAAVVNLGTRLCEIMREQNVDEKVALKVLAKERGISKSEVYREVQRRLKPR